MPVRVHRSVEYADYLNSRWSRFVVNGVPRSPPNSVARAPRFAVQSGSCASVPAFIESILKAGLMRAFRRAWLTRNRLEDVRQAPRESLSHSSTLRVPLSYRRAALHQRSVLPGQAQARCSPRTVLMSSMSWLTNISSIPRSFVGNQRSLWRQGFHRHMHLRLYSWRYPRQIQFLTFSWCRSLSTSVFVRSRDPARASSRRNAYFRFRPDGRRVDPCYSASSAAGIPNMLKAITRKCVPRIVRDLICEDSGDIAPPMVSIRGWCDPAHSTKEFSAARSLTDRPILYSARGQICGPALRDATIGPPRSCPDCTAFTSDPAAIPFADLPQRFVVKPTHGSGWVRVVLDKAALDVRGVAQHLQPLAGKQLLRSNAGAALSEDHSPHPG